MILTLPRETGELCCCGDAATAAVTLAVALLVLRGDAFLLPGLA
jgi:hypothetical protein